MLHPLFLKYSKIYADHGYSLYMVGGSARDHLLGKEIRDLDFVTDATPEESFTFLKEVGKQFARFGIITIKDDGQYIDIATFRKESGYVDSRHPNKIVFVKDMYTDSCRRDFTINALYVDANEKVYDFHDGLKDLHDGIIRFIGDPMTRVKEDPLRILRARRFAKRFGFRIEPLTEKAIVEGEPLLLKLNPEKVIMEQKKE